jgi:hypothetical protein
MEANDRASEPRALVIAAQEWPLAAFVAIALRRSGFSISGLCPDRHPLRYTAAVDRCFPFSSARSDRSLARAIRTSSPAILVPCDDQSVYAIYDFYARCARRRDAEARHILGLIVRSLGNPCSFEVARSKSQFLAVARACQVSVPETRELRSRADLVAHCETTLPPFVLKQDGTFGGLGVIVARNKEEATQAWKRLRMRTAVNASRQLIFKRNHTPLAALMKASPTISVQKYIQGRPANRAVLCWHGRVLAGATVATLEADPSPNGPATVVEFIREPEIDSAVETLVSKLGLSGFCGFDFMLDQSTGQPFLLELNPRATSACWLGTRPGSDLCTALFRALQYDAAASGSAPADLQVSGENLRGERAALFPQEWMRAKTSPHLASAYHRVPWDDPDFVAFLMNAALTKRGRTAPSFFRRLARHVAFGRDDENALRSNSGESSPEGTLAVTAPTVEANDSRRG